jgi:V8-like Glu-specific endopeptidase
MRVSLAILILSAGRAWAQSSDLLIEAQVDGRTEERDIRIAAENFNATGPVWWRQPFNKIGTEYLRFHIRATGGSEASDARVTVEGVGSQDFSYGVAEIGEEGLWTGLLPGGRAVISLIAESRPEDLVVEIDRISFEAPTGTPFSAWGDNDMKHVHQPEVPDTVRTLMLPVAKLVFQSGGLPKTCTGFLIGENALLTNEHCINSADACESLVVVFGYERAPDGGIRFGEQFRCAAFNPDQSSFELDATLIELNGTPSLAYGKVDFPDADTDITGPLIIIQHPGGEPKQVSFIECMAMTNPVDGRGPETDFTHTCDTAGGSSGAPVFDQEGRLVGLHHYGFAEEQIEGWTENRAVRLVRIREWLASRSDDDSG